MSDLNLYNGSGEQLPEAVTYSKQTKSSAKQAQARENINAAEGGSSPTPSGGAVRYDTAQSLTSAQMETARQNIGAAASGESPIPAPKAAYADELEDTIAKVKALQKDEPSLAWIRYTDAHYGYNQTYAAQKKILEDAIPVFNELRKNLKIEFIVDTGDLTNGDGHSLEEQMPDRERALYIQPEIAKAGLPIMMTPGNHDPMQNAPQLTMHEFFEYYARFTDDEAIRNLNLARVGTEYEYSRNGTDFYIDYPQYQIRMVFINAAKRGYTDVNTWFKGLIDSLPDHWNMIMFSHFPTFSGQERPSTGTIITPSGGDTATENIARIEANGTDRHYIATVYGHTHYDGTFAYPHFGINTTSEKFITGVGYPDNGFVSYGTAGRVAGRASEHAIDVMVYRPVSKALHVVRFGAGVDRIIHYIPKTVAVGGTITITPDNEAVSWELWQYIDDSTSEHYQHYRSDAVTFASVSDGVVTGISAGTVGVRAYDTNGNYEMWRVIVS